jgi:formylglycine-generating enzyme required for sulfatase activity
MDRLSAALLGLFAVVGGASPAPDRQTYMVTVAAGAVHYQLPAASPVSESVAAFHIMRRQVSQAEYAACVRGGGCKALDKPWQESRDGRRPVVGLSWQDATAYAQWLSASSGALHRLPRYAEWLRAVGEDYVLHEPLVAGSTNPAPDEPQQRLLRFTKQGSSGALSLASDIWEWTDTCFAGAADGFCGIRIAAGRHPSALPDFVRDPAAGAFSVGAAPAHVGLRLVRE